MTIEANGKFTFLDLWRGNMFFYRGNLFFFSILGCLSLGLGVFLSIVGDGGMRGQLPTIFVGLFVALYLWGAILYRSYRNWKVTPGLKGLVQYRFDDGGIAIEGPYFRGEVKWPGIVKWREGKHTFLIYSNPKIANIVPKRFFRNPLEVDAVRRLLRDNVGGKK